MKHLLILLIFWTIQDKSTISLRTELLKQSNSKIHIKITATNTDSLNGDNILFYTLDKEDVCMSILNIDFINKEGGKPHEFFPCTWMTDIDRITLNQTNSVILKPGDSYIFNLEIDYDDVSPFLEEGNYSIVTSLDYEVGNFQTDFDNQIFRGYLTSNELELEIKK